MATDKHFEEYAALATLPLRDVVVYPHMVLPLFVGREKSIAALDLAMANDEPVFLLAQRDPNEEEPRAEDLHEMGTVAQVLQVLKLPDGTVKVLVEGIRRGRALRVEDNGELFVSHVEFADDTDTDNPDMEALRRTLLSQFDQFAKLNKKIPAEVIGTIHGISDNSRLVDTVAAHLQLKLEQRQDVLGMVSIAERMEYLLGQLEAELDIMQVEKRIRGRVKRQMEKSQREYYLNEQVKAIQKELGEEDERGELEALEKQIQEAGMSKEAEEKCLSELKKLKMMPPMSAESTVVRNYIDTLLELPWKKKSRVSKDLAKADLVLNADHYGLEKVKERILEYLAVQKRMDKIKGPILCLVGPPGV
ncbi:LON peptidase substrate-binding domain-containing protein, partial [Neisseria dentiae]